MAMVYIEQRQSNSGKILRQLLHREARVKLPNRAFMAISHALAALANDTFSAESTASLIRVHQASEAHGVLTLL